MTKSDNADLQIAGTRTAKYWTNRKAELESPNCCAALWEKTFDEFFMERLASRYLQPIKSIQTNGDSSGEGFAIVTIQCAVIEFLAATKIGKNYRYVHNGDPKLNDFEYDKSKMLFIGFLTKEKPFSGWLADKKHAEDFYSNVRCGLMHEASTKGGWRISAMTGQAIDPANKIIHRDDLQTAIQDFIDDYRKLLLADKPVQEAFIRKFDHLAIA